MSLLNYWPTLEEINNCIKAEAENASDEVLLAVHQKFPLSHQKVGPDGRVMPESSTVATEEDLLSYFIGDAPSGSHVIPITGASGVGKSHLIRILEARLRHLPDAHRYLVIRIPKSASLRRVVEMILKADPLKNKKYDQVKEAFAKALADVPLDEAVIRFQSQLEIALKDYASELKERYRKEPSDSILKEKIGHAEALPKLMSDAETRDHFRSIVLPRIIQRSVKGADFDGGELKEIDPTKAQFNIDDLSLNDVDFGKTSEQVAKYYKLALVARVGRGKTVAIDVLNEVVDKATSQLYKLNDSLGGMTLGEVILEIRRLLLADHRDLVILVEDFAALVGIQDTLSKVLIQEGVTSRGQEFATIRSAIAVTDGYLGGLHTLATRAGRKWVVESQLKSEDEALRRTKLLVASYINAARHGESYLKRYYRKVFVDSGYDKKRWSVPVYSGGSEEDYKILNAFGHVGDVPLFPFTEQAIECLALSALKEGNTVVFTPRYVINNIIREILRNGREAFVNKHFPPPDISAPTPETEVAQWVSSLNVSDDQRERYKRLVTIWGNEPKKLSDIGRIPKEVFDIFELPQPKIDYPHQTDQQKSDKKKDKDEDSPKIVTKPETKINPFNDILETWVKTGSKLDQNTALLIRKALAYVINQRIDWNAERCTKHEITPNHLSIPNARGEGNITTSSAIKIAQDSKDPDGRLRGDLMSLLRYFEVYKPGNDYDGIEDDLARIANLVDRLLPEALNIVRSSVQKQTQLVILALAANSRLLGISEKGRTLNAVSSFLFGDAETIETLPESAPTQFRDWRALQNSAIQIRSQLRKLLTSWNGCFQGTGSDPKIYGVDIVRLVENYPDEGVHLDIAEVQLTTDLKQSLQSMTDAKVNARINQVLQEIKKISDTIKKELGDEFNKNEIVDVIMSLADKLRQIGRWNNDDIGFSANQFSQLCVEFKSTAVKECLALLQKINEPDENGIIQVNKINRVAQLSLVPLITTERFLEQASKVVKSANKQAQTLEEQFMGVNPVEKAKAIEDTFNDLLADLALIKEGGA